MTDLDLLIFGCVVSFIAWAGMYIYVREIFTRGETKEDREVPVHIEPGDAAIPARARVASRRR